MKSALGFRDFKPFRECLDQIEPDMAVTVRRQIERADGIGEHFRSDMLRTLREMHPQLWIRRRLEPWEDPDVLWTTQAGYKAKSDEINEILNVKMPENARAIGRAAEHGDLSENSEYKFALEERDLLRARLAKLNDEMSRARVLEHDDVPADRVSVGSHVVLSNKADGSTREMTFFGPWDADVENGVFNYRAPVAQKLMGTHVGDVVELTIDDRDVEFEVAAIGNAIAHKTETAGA
jgi:transcription elongation factor GreA